MPELSNQAVLAIEDKLGPYGGDFVDQPDLLQRGPHELDNGAIYIG